MGGGSLFVLLTEDGHVHDARAISPWDSLLLVEERPVKPLEVRPRMKEIEIDRRSVLPEDFPGPGRVPVKRSEHRGGPGGLTGENAQVGALADTHRPLERR